LPRPPSAYALFLSSFIRVLPGEISAQQPTSTLSDAQHAWRALREQEKQMWAVKARNTMAGHASRFPKYAFCRLRHRGVKGKLTKEL
ncbi:hypothetical protein B0H11DRAFT_1739258, partial [Mycena galericulata]